MVRKKSFGTPDGCSRLRHKSVGLVIFNWPCRRGGRTPVRQNRRQAILGAHEVRDRSVSEDAKHALSMFGAHLAFVGERSELTKAGALRAERAVIPLCPPNLVVME